MLKKLINSKYKIIILLFLMSLLIGAANENIYNTSKNLFSNIKLLTQVLHIINSNYVEDKSFDILIEDAINGMILNLDPHSKYLNTEKFNNWNKNYKGYSGIGISYDIIQKKITVMSVFEDGPSDKVGLKPGDRIVAINGISSYGIIDEEVPNRLMGAKGTIVNISVERYGWSTHREFSIIRDKVHVKSIPYIFMINQEIGYIKIIRFSETTKNEITNGLKLLRQQGMKKLILDLRNNGGGYLRAAVGVVDRFLNNNKKIVYTEGRIDKSFSQFHSTNTNTYGDIPLIILINRFSASASEIVAGSLQDWDRALIIGETSFGKGLVQTQYKLNDGSALFITTARYYTPCGRLIQRPFNNKAQEKYYNEIVDDSLRLKWENDSSRPQYKTLILQRTILGGGGITPDIIIKFKKDTISNIVRNIYYSKKRLFYTFTEQYIKKNNSYFDMEVKSFLNDYKLNMDIFNLFINYIQKERFKISPAEISANRKDISFLLKQSIAQHIWGKIIAYKVRLLKDHQFIESKKLFSKADNLINESLRNNK